MFVLVTLGCFSLLGIGQSTDIGPVFKASINEAVAQAKRDMPRLGVSIVDLASGQSLYDYRGGEMRILASNTKLFTSGAALDILGPGYQFETPFLMRGEVVEGTLHGDIAVVGSGDPNISGRFHDGDPLAIFRGWAKELRKLGVERVEGRLLLVDGLFSGPLVHPEWPKNQLTEWYEAPVSALSFSDNCLLVKVWGSSRPGRSAVVEVLPQLDVFPLKNQARTTSNRKAHRVSIDRRSDGIYTRGSVWGRANPVDSWVTVENPTEYFGLGVRQAFKVEGVEIIGESKALDRIPSGAWHQVALHRSDLLSTLEVINKRSQNFYAESVLKTLGARSCGEGSWTQGTRTVKEFATNLGIDPAKLKLSDGSGMSRTNESSAAEVTRFLVAMAHHRWGREYLQTLPHSGESGLRWHKRLAEDPYNGNVLAKTGSLNGVSTLSGYVKASSGRHYAFSILGNRVPANWKASKAQDRLLRAIVDNG